MPAPRKPPGKLQDRIRQLYNEGVQGKTSEEVQFQVLHEVVLLSSRVGESFSVELLNLVPATLADRPGRANIHGDCSPVSGWVRIFCAPL